MCQRCEAMSIRLVEAKNSLNQLERENDALIVESTQQRREIKILRRETKEAYRDYDDVVAANYRLVMWAKSLGHTIPTTGELEKRYGNIGESLYTEGSTQ